MRKLNKVALFIGVHKLYLLKPEMFQDMLKVKLSIEEKIINTNIVFTSQPSHPLRIQNFGDLKYKAILEHFCDHK